MARRPARGRDTGEGSARERIMAAAIKELIEGDGDFEIADVARRAGVSVGLAYHYYGSKAGLIAVLIGDYHDRHQAIVNHSVDDSLPWPIQAKARLKANVDFLYADPFTRLVMGKLRSSAEVIAIDTGRRALAIELAARNIANGQRQGHISAEIDPVVAGAAIVGGINQAVAYALSSRRRPTAGELTERLWTFISGAVSLAREAPDVRSRRPASSRKQMRTKA